MDRSGHVESDAVYRLFRRRVKRRAVGAGGAEPRTVDAPVRGPREAGGTLRVRALRTLQRGGWLGQRAGLVVHPAVWFQRHVTGRYAIPEFDNLRHLVVEGSVVLDVGAHAGSWTVPLAHAVGPQGLVIGYEAFPYYSRALRRLLRWLRIRNTLIRSVAVSHSQGDVTLRWRSEDGTPLTGRTHIEPSSGRAGGSVIVEMTSLDHDLEVHGIDYRRVSFIKIDVEGAELPVLRGAHKILGMARPAVYLEAEEQWTQRFGYSVADIFVEMQSLNYAGFVVTERGLQPTDCDDYLCSSTLRNVLFVSCGPSQAGVA